MGRGESDGDVGFICARRARNGEGVRRAEIILVRRSWLVAGAAGEVGGRRRRRSEATGAGAETVAGRGRAAGRGEMK